MADQESTSGASAGVMERPVDDEAAAEVDEKRRKKQAKKDDDLEYEVELATPFGKLEFEFEPLTRKMKKDRERKAKAEREAAKKQAAELVKRAEREASRARGGGGASRLMVVGVLAGAVILAYWLFARPEEEDAVPPEFASATEPQPAAQGFIGRARARVREAIRAGRRASREAQREQREKFERMTGTTTTSS